MNPEPPAPSLPTEGKLFGELPAAPMRDEHFDTLLARTGARIERIVSTGQRSPPGFWYCQDSVEWVALLQGEAELRFEDETAPRRLAPGDWLLIEAGRRHRVESTSAVPPAVWLAVFLPA
jgi:cupin 2 domain-containing protein